MEYLPSKNFIKFVGSFLVILGLGWLILFLWNNKNDSSTSSGQASSGQANQDLEKEENKDTDKDGLKNWEEALWKTNPEITDTDGDATNDGDEIKMSRNPKIAGTCSERVEGCTDKLLSPEDISKSENPDQPSTFTAKIAQEFGKNYFAGKGLAGGKDLSASAQQSLANSLTLEIEQGVAAYQDVFKKEDIKISTTLDAKIYLNKFGSAFNKNFRDISSYEIDIIGLVLSEEHFKNTKLFDPLLIAYKNMVLFLQKEIVPESYSNLHLSALNIMQNTLFAVRSMKNIEEDPAKAIVGIRLYIKETERAQEFLKNLKEQIKKDGIKFEEKEGGYFFKQYFEQIKD